MEKIDNSDHDIRNVENIRKEFDFFELLRILWKRRYIILIGTAAIVVVVLWVGLSMPRIFRSQMVLKPGLSHVDKEEKWVWLDVPSNMQFLIESELKYKLEMQLREKKMNELSPALNYKTLPDDSKNTLTVLCDSLSPDDGILKLQLLLDALKGYYQKRLLTFLNQYESEIALNQDELKHISKEQEFINANLNNIQKILEKFIQENNRDSGNFETPNHMGTYLANYSAVVERISRLKQLQYKNDLKKVSLNHEIKRLENEKNTANALYVIQSPTIISAPDRTSLILNLLAAPVIGFFLMIFIVFFVEYLRKVVAKIKHDKIFA